MNWTGIGICLAAAVLNALAQLLLKQFFSVHPLELSLSALWWTARQPVVMAGVGIQVLGMIAWWLILSRLPLSIGFPVTVGMIYLLVAVGSVVFLGEHIGPKTLAGIVFVSIGVVLIGG